MIAASIARMRLKNEPRHPGFCEVGAGALDGYAAGNASGEADGKTEGKTGARNEYPQLSQVCACGGLDLLQFGQFILTPPLKNFDSTATPAQDKHSLCSLLLVTVYNNVGG